MDKSNFEFQTYVDPGMTPPRMKNRRMLEASGVDLFPAKGWRPDHKVSELAGLFNIHADLAEGDRPRIRVAGRLVARRAVGGVWFGDLWQEHARIQLRLVQDRVDCKVWMLLDHLDIGDFLGVEGRLVRTRRGELTIDVNLLQVLGKPSTTPAIGKLTADGNRHDAQTDRGALLRERRHVELMTNDALFDNIRTYAKVLKIFRDVLEEDSYLEVQTSVMGRFYGGAAAAPFTTRSRALGEDLYLRVSPEPDLKRLLAGGFDRVYEIGRNWRNEGVDPTHQPSFTAFEAYRAWADYEDMMELTERLLSRCVKSLYGSYRIRRRGVTLDFEPPWPRHRMTDLVSESLCLTPGGLTLEALQKAWDTRTPPGNQPHSWGEYVVAIFEEYVESTLVGPCFVIDYPVEGSPLTKRHRDDPLLVERFEAYIGGIELANAYSELNDPIEQRRRLEHQDNNRDEPYGLDEYFLAAVEDGLPQAGGLGIGMDRLVMILTDAERLADVLPFPLS